jgi:hypothetical protein
MASQRSFVISCIVCRPLCLESLVCTVQKMLLPLGSGQHDARPRARTLPESEKNSNDITRHCNNEECKGKLDDMMELCACKATMRLMITISYCGTFL